MAKLDTLFGTDGVRGRVNRFPMTAELALALGRSVTHLLRARGAERPKILIGRDTRASGLMLEQALSAGICSMGGAVRLLGVIPTSGVAYLAHARGADAGIVVSASHNPAEDNGIKIFAGDGFKLSEQLEREIEMLALSGGWDLRTVDPSEVGRPIWGLRDRAAYARFLLESFPGDLSLAGMRLALDCAEGAAWQVAPAVFRHLGAEVHQTGAAPDGFNINSKCGAVHPERMAGLTLDRRAHLGISLDGDGDRVILSDELGRLVDGERIIGICALFLSRRGELPGRRVVTTWMSNMGLEETLERNGISVARVPVGDRNVIERMRAEGIVLGGEPCGHVVLLDRASSGDGILVALRVLEVMLRTGKPLSALADEIRMIPQVQHHIRVRSKEPFEKFEDVQQSIHRAREALRGRGRVFVRYSGTEPKARVLLEGDDLGKIQQLSSEIAAAIGARLGG